MQRKLFLVGFEETLYHKFIVYGTKSSPDEEDWGVEDKCGSCATDFKLTDWQKEVEYKRKSNNQNYIIKVMEAPSLHICNAPTFSHLSLPSLHKQQSPFVRCYFNPLNGNGNARNISDYWLTSWTLTKVVLLEVETEVEGINIVEEFNWNLDMLKELQVEENVISNREFPLRENKFKAHQYVRRTVKKSKSNSSRSDV
eukprot:Gb_01933 [translate_table: standard]